MIAETVGTTETLAQYGLLGVILILLIYAVRYLMKRDELRDAMMVEVVKNNTIALTQFVDKTKKCEVKR